MVPLLFIAVCVFTVFGQFRLLAALMLKLLKLSQCIARASGHLTEGRGPIVIARNTKIKHYNTHHVVNIVKPGWFSFF